MVYRRSSAKTRKPRRKAPARRRTTRRRTTTRRRQGNSPAVPMKRFQLFNWRKDWQCGIGQGSSTALHNWNFGSPGATRYSRTYPQSQTPSSICFLGSHFSTPLGEPVDPTSTSYTYDGMIIPTTVNLIEDLPSGYLNWGAFYQASMAIASKFSIMMYPITTAPCCYKYVVFPIVNSGISHFNSPTYTGPQTLSRPNWNNPTGLNIKRRLDSMDYMELSSQPGCRYGFIKNAGSAVTKVSFGWKSTRRMLNLKDLQDNDDDLEMAMAALTNNVEQPTFVTTSVSNNQEAGSLATGDSYMYYVRVFNDSLDYDTPDETVLQFQVRIKYKAVLYDRKSFEQTLTNTA